jgi:hypothetical protein
MRKVVLVLVALVATIGAAAGFSHATTRDETVKRVMKEAMKSGLCKSVASGTASDADKAKLLQLFKDLATAEPAAGDKASWETKTAALVKAAQAAADGKADAGATLKQAANCKACHDVHKGN